MPRFRLQDLPSLESSPTSPASLGAKVGDLIVHSVSAVAQVELLDRETGEYRVVLQGTLDLDNTPPRR